MSDNGAEPPPKKRKYTKRKNVTVKDAKEGKGKKEEATYDVLGFQTSLDEKETANVMADVAARRLRKRDSQQEYPQLNTLSEWRLFQEIARQQRPEAGARVSLSSIRADAGDGSKNLVGFDPELLDVLQLGATAHIRDVLVGAARVAQQRRYGSQKQSGFTIVDDVRIGLGDIRKRDEDEAARVRGMEEALTLKQAAHKSADDELREKAKNLKEQRAGEQAQEAANKALAATLGGGKWDKWGIGGGMGIKTTPKTEEGVGSKETGVVEAGGGRLEGGFVIELGDILAYLEGTGEYAGSAVFWRLQNLKSMV